MSFLDRWLPWRLRAELERERELHHRTGLAYSDLNDEVTDMQRGMARAMGTLYAQKLLVPKSTNPWTFAVTDQEVESKWEERVKLERIWWSIGLALPSSVPPEAVAEKLGEDAKRAVIRFVLQKYRSQSILKDPA